MSNTTSSSVRTITDCVEGDTVYVHTSAWTTQARPEVISNVRVSPTSGRKLCEVRSVEYDMTTGRQLGSSDLGSNLSWISLKSLCTIEAGDTVVIHTGSRARAATVERSSKTEVVVEGTRFKRNTGRRVGSTSGHISVDVAGFVARSNVNHGRIAVEEFAKLIVSQLNKRVTESTNPTELRATAAQLHEVAFTLGLTLSDAFNEQLAKVSLDCRSL